MFTRQITELISDESYAELQELIVHNPKAGDLISGTNGLRKIRWKIEGVKGKRGGIRVIYYWYVSDDLIYMLIAYPKNEQDDLTPKQKSLLKQLVKEEFKDE